jgi:hypothetical protein
MFPTRYVEARGRQGVALASISLRGLPGTAYRSAATTAFDAWQTRPFFVGDSQLYFAFVVLTMAVTYLSPYGQSLKVLHYLNDCFWRPYAFIGRATSARRSVTRPPDTHVQ